MADFYKEMQDIATPLLRQFKQGKIELARASEGPIDPTKPWEPGNITTTKLTLAGSVSGVKAYQIDGKQIEASDLVVTVAAVDSKGIVIDPKESDVLLIDGKVREIKKIEQRPAAGTPVVYVIFVAG